MTTLLTDVDRLTDRELTVAAARVIGVPRAEVTGNGSFVLHAALELLARAALLPAVQPEARSAARARIALLADRYESSGPALEPPRSGGFDSVSAAADTLVAAATAGDLGTADAAAAWLGDHAAPDQLIAQLGGFFLPALDAAAHANIHLALLARTQPRGLPGQMLRHPVAALTTGAPRRIEVPPVTVSPDPVRTTAELLDAIVSTPVIGPAPGWGIAAMVEHAQEHGSSRRLCGPDGTLQVPDTVPLGLLRFAAHTMLQGPVDRSPYGWTHCLTLAQAPLQLAGRGADTATAVAVAVTQLVAHWATLGHGTVDLDHQPDHVSMSIHDALAIGPAEAAAAAWHASEPDQVVTAIATQAAVNNDAHRVKYTLACLDAAAADPAASRLHLAAAAHLNAWWNLHGDADDPMPELASMSVPAPEHASVIG